jgi:hypothetical protein
MYNFKSNKITYRKLCSNHNIKIISPKNRQWQYVKQLNPTDARRTLGAILAPDGSSSGQLKHTLLKVKEFYTKFKLASLTNKAKWIAYISVLLPEILYLVMATLYTEADIRPLHSIMDQLACHALGLNKHFPRSILHGPLHLGGLGLPSVD